MFPWVLSILLLKIVNVASQNVTIPVILVDCPTGDAVTKEFIREGTYATCRCQKGDPSQGGQVVWWQVINKNITQTFASSAAGDYSLLKINTERRDIYTKAVYVCFIQDGDNSSAFIAYQPKIAYGPDPNSLMINPEMNSHWITDLCPGQAHEITIVCDISVASVWPVPAIGLHVIDNVEEYIILSANYSVVDTFYRFTTIFGLESPGRYDVICNLSNVLFPSINQAIQHDFYVREPPISLPVFTISNAGKTDTLSNGSTIYALGNSYVAVACRVSGGTPEVNSVNIACDKGQNTEIGTSASLQFEMTQTDAIICTCGANHISGCYSHTSVIQIVAVYQALVVNFTANSLSDTLTDDRGSKISFMCQATGSPIPSLSLLRSDKTALKEIKGLEIDESYMNVQCDFTNRYYCVAKNGLETNIELPQRSIDVYVKCLTVLRQPSNQNMVIEVKVGAAAIITIQVTGYPAPSSFLLTVPTSKIEIAVNQSKYSVLYQADQNEMPTPYGAVTLKINDITKDELITYKLFISNGGQLAFSFTLVEAKTNDTINIAIGVSVGVLVIIIIAIIIAIFYCRRKRQKTTQKDSTSQMYDTPHTQPRPAESVEYHQYAVFPQESLGASNSGSYITVLPNIYDTISNRSFPNNNNVHKP